MLQAGLGDGVEYLERLVQVVVAVVAVSNLELETQLELRVGHLLEAVLDLARLDQCHDLAVEGGRVCRVQVQDLVAYLQKGICKLSMFLLPHKLHYQIDPFVLIKQMRLDLITTMRF